MLPFLIRRISLGVLTLFVVISLTFLMLFLMPSSPFTKERNLPKHIEQSLLVKYRLNGTPWEQYTRYIAHVAQGDLGPSTRYRARTVNEIIGQTLPVSLQLGSIAFIIALGSGITLGSISAVGRKTWKDQAAMLVAVLSISIPTFVIAPLAILIFALMWNILPVAGWGSWKQVLLPAICLALPYSAYVARLTRTSMVEVLNQDFIRTARAKGLGEMRIVVKHALKVALLPVVSFAGPLAANLLTGSFVVEEIFKIPGIGPFFVNGVMNVDHFLVGGVVIVYSSLLIAFNIVVDILYTMLDRRIKLA